MNTEIDYLYRDASNYKKPNRVIVKGVLTDQQKQDIFRMCGWKPGSDDMEDEWDEEYGCPYDDDQYLFIPRQVGMPEDRFGELTEDGHCYFEMQNIFETDKKSTEMNDAENIYKRFMETKGNWDAAAYAIVV